MKKGEAKIDEWLREVTPRTELRKWFGYDPAKWNEFKERCCKELDKEKDMISKLTEKWPRKQGYVCVCSKISVTQQRGCVERVH